MTVEGRTNLKIELYCILSPLLVMIKETKQLQPVEPFSLFSEQDISLFQEGKHPHLYEKFGAHETTLEGVPGTYFAVWAPNAIYISVIGEFNNWDQHRHHLYPRWDKSGIWEGFIPSFALSRIQSLACWNMLK